MIYPELNFENLNKLYIDQNMSIDEVANFLGIRSNIVGRKIREAGIKKSKEMIQKHIAETNLRLYGSTCYFTSKEGSKKVKQTCLEKYNVEHPFQSNEIQKKVKQTCIERYGVDNFAKANFDKIRETNLQRYGSPSPFGSKEIQEKSKQTNMRKYGVEYAISNKEIRDKIKQVNIQRYGVNNPLKNREVYNKTKETVKNRYGVDNPFNIPKVREATRLAYESGVAQQKAFETKKKNKSWTKSEPENKVLKLLQNKFGKEDVIHHKKPDKRYSYECDFYIKSLDLFIEYQGYWKHGKEPFNQNNLKHLEIVESWKEKAKEKGWNNKNKKQYLSAIKVWTKRDPLKRETAKKNNLNFKEFWSVKEVENWLGVLNE